MKVTEILRLVWLNLSANKSKVILTSTGIIVGAATIMLVIAIGTGGKEEVAEQFKNLNAGAIDISYEYQGNSGTRHCNQPYPPVHTGEPQKDADKIQITSYKVINHTDSHSFQCMKACRDGIKNRTCIHVLKIS